MPNVGPLELIVVLIVVLVIFGPKRLPGLGKQLGKGMREFKQSIGGDSKDEHDDGAAHEHRAELAEAPAQPTHAHGASETAPARPEAGAPAGVRSGEGERPGAGAARDSRG